MCPEAEGWRPNAQELAACRPWLDGELAAVRPKILVCLGATAAQALLGRAFRVTRQRGQLLDAPPAIGAPKALATYHPSAVLRAPDDEARAKLYAELVADLKVVAQNV